MWGLRPSGSGARGSRSDGEASQGPVGRGSARPYEQDHAEPLGEGRAGPARAVAWSGEAVSVLGAPAPAAQSRRNGAEPSGAPRAGYRSRGALVR